MDITTDEISRLVEEYRATRRSGLADPSDRAARSFAKGTQRSVAALVAILAVGGLVAYLVFRGLTVSATSGAGARARSWNRASRVGVLAENAFADAARMQEDLWLRTGGTPGDGRPFTARARGRTRLWLVSLFVVVIIIIAAVGVVVVGFLGSRAA